MSNKLISAAHIQGKSFLYNNTVKRKGLYCVSRNIRIRYTIPIYSVYRNWYAYKNDLPYSSLFSTFVITYIGTQLTNPHINMVNIWGWKQCMEAQTCFRSLSIHGMYHYHRNSCNEMNLFYDIKVRVPNVGYVITKWDI